MISFTAKIQRFSKKGEKTGWSYIAVSEKQATKLNPGIKKAFRVKGFLDQHPIHQAALMPMGDGDFILPFNASMRKGTGKTAGDLLAVKLAVDLRPIKPSADFLKCLKDDARALAYFNSLPKGHQNYFSKWIDSAKTIETKTKRIAMALTALAAHKGFGEMLRENKRFA